MIRAKSKVKAQRQRELEDRPVPVVRREEPAPPSKISGGEIINVIAGTLQRLYRHEYNSEIDRVNAEDKARWVALALKYGVGRERGAKITEEEMTLPLCEKCDGEAGS